MLLNVDVMMTEIPRWFSSCSARARLSLTWLFRLSLEVPIFLIRVGGLAKVELHVVSAKDEDFSGPDKRAVGPKVEPGRQEDVPINPQVDIGGYCTIAGFNRKHRPPESDNRDEQVAVSSVVMKSVDSESFPIFIIGNGTRTDV